MNNLEVLEKEGLEFLKNGYADLPDLAKMHVIAYMRGIKEGMSLVSVQQTEHSAKHNNA